MLRKEFLKTCCTVCVGGNISLLLLQGCNGSKIITAIIEDAQLIVPIKEFDIVKKDKVEIRKYLVAQNDRLQYPICIFRLSETSYSAVWMRCTHQGTELQVYGDKLHCPAHGSEFNNRGGMENGPAADPLKTFPVMVEGDKLKISLK